MDSLNDCDVGLTGATGDSAVLSPIVRRVSELDEDVLDGTAPQLATTTPTKEKQFSSSSVSKPQPTVDLELLRRRVNVPGPRGATPLIMVSTLGQCEEVKALVTAGADPNLEVHLLYFPHPSLPSPQPFASPAHGHSRHCHRRHPYDPRRGSHADNVPPLRRTTAPV